MSVRCDVTWSSAAVPSFCTSSKQSFAFIAVAAPAPSSASVSTRGADERRVALGETLGPLEARVGAVEVVRGHEDAREVDARRDARRQVARAVDVREELAHELGHLARRAGAVHRRREVAQPRCELDGRVRDNRRARARGSCRASRPRSDVRGACVGPSERIRGRAIAVARFEKSGGDAIGVLDGAFAEGALVGRARGGVHLAPRLGRQGVDDDLAQERRHEFHRRGARAPDERPEPRANRPSCRA